MVASVMFAKSESDIALTWGYNSFNDDTTLYGATAFYGLRAGIYPSENLGLQFGYEQTNHGNCQGLKLKRYYTNALLQTDIGNGLKPYALGTLGYETSSKEYRPSQTFAGVGAGLKYVVDKNFNIFLETRALKSLKSDDVTYASTFGVGYIFDTGDSTTEVIEKEVLIPQKKQTIITSKIKPVKIEAIEATKSIPGSVNVYHDSSHVEPIISQTIKVKPSFSKGDYFVQIAALTTSSPSPILRKLRAHGVDNVHVKKMYKKGTSYSFVVVGPYQTRASATKALKKLKAVNAGVFIKKF